MVVTEEGEFQTKTFNVCLDTFEASSEANEDGCCNDTACIYSFVIAGRDTGGGTLEVTAYPVVGVDHCETRATGAFGRRRVGCALPLTCEDPIADELSCQDYADEFSSVVVGNEEKQTCFQLVGNGSLDGVRVGTLCLRIVELGEKTCVKFAFIAFAPWEFRGA
ncbi:hypothetical protein NDN08_005748 [Rhodosorus marinus]|uniref:Uncharacterized protein n=1 Tax=Rhodosorus marinus TaxID=101924 RepID=A0AAV8V2G8_9RHOD|nr:hypothetical protein NDN08_005748 [Rhodosorus marinus]